jgi:hypothetical protein
MAYAIMGGLAVATLLTLVFLPALYVTWFRVKRPGSEPCRPSQSPAEAATRNQVVADSEGVVPALEATPGTSREVADTINVSKSPAAHIGSSQPSLSRFSLSNFRQMPRGA